MAHNILSTSEDTLPRGRRLTAAQHALFVAGVLVLWHKPGDHLGLFVWLSHNRIEEPLV
jgi:hypothetical protein